VPRATKANGSQRSEALTGPQTTALIALVGGASVTAAAKEAGCDRSTVSGWVHHGPAFRAALEEARHAVWTSQVDRVRAVAGKALDVLEAVLDDASAPTSERLRAAREVLSVAGLGSQAAPRWPRTAAEIHADEADRKAKEDLFREPGCRVSASRRF